MRDRRGVASLINTDDPQGTEPQNTRHKASTAGSIVKQEGLSGCHASQCCPLHATPRAGRTVPRDAVLAPHSLRVLSPGSPSDPARREASPRVKSQGEMTVGTPSLGEPLHKAQGGPSPGAPSPPGSRSPSFRDTCRCFLRSSPRRSDFPRCYGDRGFHPAS